MSRASRVYQPGYVFHITQRCHKKEFLLKFQRDRDRYRHWLYKAQARYGLSILNYIITSNHIHILVKENTAGSVSEGMQYISGCFGREFNRRKQRKGAYWEDSYHLSIVQTEEYLMNCHIYIDLNMVRAGVVKNPIEWKHSGYYDIHVERQRYRIIDIEYLLDIWGFSELSHFKAYQNDLVQCAIHTNQLSREPIWTEDKVIGSEGFLASFGY